MKAIINLGQFNNTNMGSKVYARSMFNSLCLLADTFTGEDYHFVPENNEKLNKFGRLRC